MLVSPVSSSEMNGSVSPICVNPKGVSFRSRCSERQLPVWNWNNTSDLVVLQAYAKKQQLYCISWQASIEAWYAFTRQHTWITTNFRLHLWQIFRNVSQAMSCTTTEAFKRLQSNRVCPMRAVVMRSSTHSWRWT